MKNELVKSTVPSLPACITLSAATLPQTIDCGLHFHDEMEFISVIRGTYFVWVDEKQYEVHSGDVIFINARVPHRTKIPEGYVSSMLIQFRSDIFREQLDHSRPLRCLSYFANNAAENPVRIFSATNGTNELFDVMMKIKGEYEKRRPYYEMYLRGFIYEILGYLYRETVLHDPIEQLNRQAVEKVMPALTYIDGHYAEDIPLAILSERCGLSEGYFCRQFKAAIGSTFIEYLNFVRIYHAEKLLTRTSKPILDISMEVGFSTVSYFNRMFRRYKSCSPNSYRRAQYQSEKNKGQAPL